MNNDKYLKYAEKAGIISAERDNNQMSNDTIKDNRILAEFENSFLGPCKLLQYQTSFYHENYNDLHRVWEKFRGLRFGDLQIKSYYDQHKKWIVQAMAYGTLTDLYNALVQAVKWYNEVTKQKQ